MNNEDIIKNNCIIGLFLSNVNITDDSQTKERLSNGPDWLHWQ